ncbi:MAG: ribonuclease P protein subunit [Candidatus Thalassarchaeaceae archaeon]|nr:ribonuclease P protein subunit [Candidatus Thalassarchaeaceae archaeon]
MTNQINLPFLARTLTVQSSTDSQLTGLSGLVVGESRQMIDLEVDGITRSVAKNTIKFTLDSNDEIIQGAMVCQRPEDRIHRNYRRN